MSGEQLRALAQAATPGPWTWFPRNGRVGSDEGICMLVADTFPTGNGPKHNAAFIAAANPTAVLALLDERDALRAQVERVRAVLAAPGWHPRHAAHEGCHICMFHGQLSDALDPEERA